MVARPKANEVAPLEIRSNQLIVCFGGPRHGAVYFETFGPNAWSEMLRVSEPGPTSTIHCYAATDQYRMHPRFVDVRCRVYAYVKNEGGSNA